MDRILFGIFLICTCEGLGLKSPLSEELKDPGWQDVFAAGGMHFGHGRAKRFVELNDNQPNVPHQACLLPNGKPGHCRHLHYCVQEEFQKDFTKFLDYFCIIQHSSIGVCCPDWRSDGYSDTAVAGDLPATASKDEDEINLKLHDRFENRGCGLSTRTQSAVVGARQPGPREWPWMASVTHKGVLQYSGGVLISERHVITAAHCTREYKADDLLVRLGEYDFRRTNDSRTYDFTVIELRQHERFELANYRNDIAILKLHRAAVFNTYVWPICLPPLGLELENKIAVVTGWGMEEYGGRYSKVLMEVSVPVWVYETCVQAYSDTVFNETICAAAPEGNKDSCQGDSGGPLMYQMASGRWAVVGIVSWGLECGNVGHPGIYTRVDKYLDWIVRNAEF